LELSPLARNKRGAAPHKGFIEIHIAHTAKCIINCGPLSERSSAWLERVVWVHEVAGSNPVAPTIDFVPFGIMPTARNFGPRVNASDAQSAASPASEDHQFDPTHERHSVEPQIKNATPWAGARMASLLEPTPNGDARLNHPQRCITIEAGVRREKVKQTALENGSPFILALGRFKGGAERED
jgi:hypothetical protein